MVNFLCLLTLVFSPVFSKIIYYHDNSRPESSCPIFLTVPKSGTHLLAKALDLFDLYERAHRRGQNEKDRKILFNHIQGCFNDIFTEEKYKNKVKILMIRDPRDCFISQIHWLIKTNSWIVYSAPPGFHRMSFYDKLTSVIMYPDEKFGLRYQFHTAKKWSQVENTYVIKFEDLVGPKGGGSLEKQVQTLRFLATALDFVTLTDEDLATIANNLFGDTNTFLKGQIGSWKKDFSQFHKDLVKRELGEELIFFGYENDLNW